MTASMRPLLAYESSAISSLSGVQPSCSPSNRRAVRVHMRNPLNLHDKTAQRPWQKQPFLQGRIGEVVPPASRRYFSTFPYSHLAVLNGNPAMPPQQFALQEVRRG